MCGLALDNDSIRLNPPTSPAFFVWLGEDKSSINETFFPCTAPLLGEPLVLDRLRFVDWGCPEYSPCVAGILAAGINANGSSCSFMAGSSSSVVSSASLVSSLSSLLSSSSSLSLSKAETPPRISKRFECTSDFCNDPLPLSLAEASVGDSVQFGSGRKFRGTRPTVSAKDPSDAPSGISGIDPMPFSSVPETGKGVGRSKISAYISNICEPFESGAK
mmetsp:Transcript_11117/g.16052  ORF Transcript_11117/g.16052 Transcript_11117/m.16052 type:complete len:218 (-) Transcript_11117:1037-1690(-)